VKKAGIKFASNTLSFTLRKYPVVRKDDRRKKPIILLPFPFEVDVGCKFSKKNKKLTIE